MKGGNILRKKENQPKGDWAGKEVVPSIAIRYCFLCGNNNRRLLGLV